MRNYFLLSLIAFLGLNVPLKAGVITATGTTLNYSGSNVVITSPQFVAPETGLYTIHGTAQVSDPGTNIFGSLTVDGVPVGSEVFYQGGNGPGTLPFSLTTTLNANQTLALSLVGAGGVSFNLSEGNLNVVQHHEINALSESTASIPEPSSFLLFGLGVLGVVRHTRRRDQGGVARGRMSHQPVGSETRHQMTL